MELFNSVSPLSEHDDDDNNNDDNDNDYVGHDDDAIAKPTVAKQ